MSSLEQTVLSSTESKHGWIQATLCKSQEYIQLLTLEDGRLQASNAVSTRFLSAENKRYMLQNKEKPEGICLKTWFDDFCGLKTEYCFPVYHIFSYLFPFAGCLVNTPEFNGAHNEFNPHKPLLQWTVNWESHLCSPDQLSNRQLEYIYPHGMSLT